MTDPHKHFCEFSESMDLNLSYCGHSHIYVQHITHARARVCVCVCVYIFMWMMLQ